MAGNGRQRDGREASRPTGPRSGASAVTVTGGYAIDDDEIDVARVPIPTGRTQRVASERTMAIAEEVRAAAAGFVLGLLIVLPAVLLATGRFEDAVAVVWSGRTTSEGATASRTAGDQASMVLAGEEAGADRNGPVKPATPHAAVPRPVAGLSDATIAEIDRFSEFDRTPRESADTGQRQDLTRVRSRADALIRAGDIDAARIALESARSSGDPAILLLLAQTYDPLVLERWGARSSIASVDTARSLYLLAEMAGAPAARDHLEQLRGWRAGSERGQGWISGGPR